MASIRSIRKRGQEIQRTRTKVRGAIIQAAIRACLPVIIPEVEAFWLGGHPAGEPVGLFSAQLQARMRKHEARQ